MSRAVFQAENDAFELNRTRTGGCGAFGVLGGGGRADDPDAQGYIAAFLQGLQQLGWTAGRNLRVDTRWGAGNADNIRKYSVELAAPRTHSAWPFPMKSASALRSSADGGSYF
jgi:hypothetical protein